VKILRNTFGVLVILWAGSLWALALWVLPTLFYAQSDRHLAGLLAGKLFQIETYLGLLVAGLAMALDCSRFRWGYFAAALLVLNEWGLKPLMNLAQANGTALGSGFGAWHAVAAVIYLLACFGVLRLVWLQPVDIQFAGNR
jgi:bacteriorhodopsin